MRLGAARMAHAGFLSVTVAASCGLLVLVAISNLLYVPLARRFLSFDADVGPRSQSMAALPPYLCICVKKISCLSLP